MNSPSNNSGSRDWPSAPGEAAETLAWPVLASLPRVGAPREAQPAPRRTDAAIEFPASEPSEVPAIRIATPAVAPEEFEPLSVANVQTARGTIEFRTFIDQPHLTVRGYDWSTASTCPIAAEQLPARETPPACHRRVDAGSPRMSASPPRQPAARPFAPASQSLADKVFQIHAAAAPHAGLLMTLALAASVGLLCWLTMGRPSAAPSREHVHDGPGGWPAETVTKPLSEDAGAVSAAPDQFVSEFAWRMTPPDEPAKEAKSSPAIVHEQPAGAPSAAVASEVAALAAPKLKLTDGPASTSAVAAAPAASSVAIPPLPAKPAGSEPAAATVAATPAAAPQAASAAQVAAVSASQPEPITPTPHGHAFPTTPYGEFNYFAQPTTPAPDAGAAEQTSVATRPLDASAAPTTTR